MLISSQPTQQGASPCDRMCIFLIPQAGNIPTYRAVQRHCQTGNVVIHQTIDRVHAVPRRIRTRARDDMRRKRRFILIKDTIVQNKQVIRFLSRYFIVVILISTLTAAGLIVQVPRDQKHTDEPSVRGGSDLVRKIVRTVQPANGRLLLRRRRHLFADQPLRASLLSRGYQRHGAILSTCTEQTQSTRMEVHRKRDAVKQDHLEEVANAQLKHRTQNSEVHPAWRPWAANTERRIRVLHVARLAIYPADGVGP
mmetsp:Transcript_17453/g.52199  ORF Transcript_17453/g.52199 Transcript_17453/m.52199 type:complete len:253 (+) Transcript_17453:2933-3691(+)